MNKKLVNEIINRLDKYYGKDMVCYLNHDNSWQLLVAVILSAQCTDKRVNEVTPALFERYTSIKALSEADTSELEQIIMPLGFFRSKARNIKEAMRMIHDEYDDIVPSDIDDLVRLPGVGRKTANVIRGNIYGIPSVVVDTHVKRISNKLGLTKNTDPVKIEYDLMKVLPEDHWIIYNIQIITHGRTICKAVKPQCDACFLKDICKSAKL